ncbi:MAG: low-density lipoprotein receptor class A repeat-containing protein, partial [Candidatus Thermoplasmatota archaeon]|nr:low-density lipoprotein receptor class A repeat-containing protein [Candidatus Thermoplasmatota archaeon]
MTRVYALFACLILIATPLAGCVSEELIDDIVGCMDENAENYDDNATSELVGDCIYLAMEEAFIDAMSGVKSIEEMLEDSPKAGYSQSIKMNEFNAEMGMQMDIEMDETVKVDLDNDAVYVHNSFAFVPMMTMEYTHVQVGEVVNVHYAAGGMMGEAESGSYQTRDATPNVLEVLADQVGLFSMSSGEDDMLFPTPEAEVDEDEIPEGAVTTITLDDNMESQTMTMEYTDEEGAEITMTIHIDQNEDLMSYSFHSDNGSATTTLDYQIMWGDAIVIEVNETLPKTSIPVWIDIEPWWDDDDDDTFLCDNGNEIPMDYVDDGWDDCGDGSDESDGGDDDDRDPEQMMDYMDTDDDGYLSLQELIDYINDENEQDGEPPMSSEDEEGTANWFYSGDTDGDDLLSLDEFTQLLESTGDDDGGDDGNDVYWQSYEGGHCEWEGDVDGDEDVWYCKYSEDQEYWDTWWYYCEYHEDADWHCTDDFGQSEDFEYSSGGDEWSGSDDDDEGDEMFTCDNGDEIPMDWVNDGWDDCGDGSDEYEDGDESDDEEGDVEPFRVTMMVMGQTLNAPISDFEVRFLFDCREPEDEEDDIPPSDCSIAASNGLTEGSATVDPTLT